MFDPRYTTIVTGAAGELGLRLLSQLHDFCVYGIDVKTPQTDFPIRFEFMDVGRETCCRELVTLLRETGASNVVHLAFVNDWPGAGHNLQRMWQTNVAGTARVMEAITEVNRMGGAVRKFVFPSSALVYGSHVPFAAKEDTPLAAAGSAWALHKQEADEVAQLRAAAIGACTTYLLRPHAYAGTANDNCLIELMRGVPTGKGRVAERRRMAGKRFPLVVPRTQDCFHERFQFVHVDDMARLIAWILRKPERTPALHVMNVAGRDAALTLHHCAEVAGNRIIKLRSRAIAALRLRLAWRFGLTPLPPRAFSSLLGSPTVDTTRLRAFLASDYTEVIRHTNEEAFAASFQAPQSSPLPESENSLTSQ